MRRALEDGVKLTLRRLRDIISYDAETGEFVWKAKASRKTVIGNPAGVFGAKGYRYIQIDGSMYTGARLAWFYQTKEWPAGQVIHLNGDPSDDRFENLELQMPKVASRWPSKERLMEILSFDPDTGIFNWIAPTSRRVKVGDVAGVVNPTGYRYVSVDGAKILAHRLAWFWMNGEWPEVVDHINGNRDDNRIANLRAATTAQNAWNSGKRPSNASGHKGVSWSKAKKKWHARISANYRVYLLGYFETKDEAIKAYKEAADRLHGVFANTGTDPASSPSDQLV